MIKIRRPNINDGSKVFELISKCSPLDENSRYCNLLQCSHFSDTSSIAELNGEVVGFVSGYRVPNNPSVYFVWQVAVSTKARGKNLGKRMIIDVVKDLEGIESIYTSITENNIPSQKTFASIASTLDAEVSKKVLFHEEKHFDGESNTEILWQIGPFDDVDEKLELV